MFLKNMFLFLWAYFSAVNAVPLNLTECRENSWPYDLITPFPYRTLTPIDIDTSTVRVVTVPTPIKFVAGTSERFTVTNTGYSVEVTINQPVVISSATGGLLGKDEYILYKFEFFWSGTYTGAASSQLDQSSVPIQVRTTLRNTKYGTFQNAIRYRDGLVTVVSNVQVEGYVPNQSFTTFAGILKSIQKAGTSVQIKSSRSLFSWYNNVVTQVKYYYAYPGAYIDLENENTQYDCATIIVFPKGYQSAISIPQYEYFQNLLNKEGTPITNTLSAHPSNGRPVIQFYGSTENIGPISL